MVPILQVRTSGSERTGPAQSHHTAAKWRSRIYSPGMQAGADLASAVLLGCLLEPLINKHPLLLNHEWEVGRELETFELPT